MRRPKPSGAVTRRLPRGVPPASAIALSARSSALEDVLAGLVVDQALLGRLDLARGPVEQAGAEMALELLQAVAHDRRRQAQMAAGRRQAAELDHPDEHPDVLEQRHGSVPPPAAAIVRLDLKILPSAKWFSAVANERTRNVGGWHGSAVRLGGGW